MAAPDRVLIAHFPALRQAYPLSCEYAAAEAVTRYWGRPVTQRTFLQEVPADADPHEGFRGAITGHFGGTRDYGVYAEPLVPVLQHYGYSAQVSYSDRAQLTATLRHGRPVVVWLTSGRAARPRYTATVDGDTFRLVPGAHAVVAYGFDTTGIDLMDVGYHGPQAE